jgi:hypothetical protein
MDDENAGAEQPDENLISLLIAKRTQETYFSCGSGSPNVAKNHLRFS